MNLYLCATLLVTYTKRNEADHCMAPEVIHLKKNENQCYHLPCPVLRHGSDTHKAEVSYRDWWHVTVMPDWVGTFGISGSWPGSGNGPAQARGSFLVLMGALWGQPPSNDPAGAPGDRGSKWFSR